MIGCYGATDKLPLSLAKARREFADAILDWTSDVFAELGFFDVHVLEFAGIKDFATLQAFHEFCVFIAGNNLHTRVLTFLHAGALVGKLRGRD